MILYEKAYAKINLFLLVGKKREDGFHEISTYMRPVSLADEIQIKINDAIETEISLTVDGNPNIPTDHSNLVYKAAVLFSNTLQKTAQIEIKLKKYIPSGAGLGGGSSDGAAVLRALNRFYDFPFSEEELTKMAAELGSDVPFFILSKPALCEGRGEKLTELHPTCTPYAVIVAGKEHSSTAAAYRLLDEWKEANLSNTVHFPNFDNFTAKDVYNDFEAPISVACPSVKEHLTILKSFSPIVCAMSGSGSAVFALFETEEEAIKAQTAFHDGAFICKLL